MFKRTAYHCQFVTLKAVDEKSEINQHPKSGSLTFELKSVVTLGAAFIEHLKVIQTLFKLNVILKGFFLAKRPAATRDRTGDL